MPKYLGIDYGTRRVGISISDDRGRIAFPYSVLAKSGEELIKNIVQIIKKEKIDLIVLGMPKSLEMKNTKMTNKVLKFADKLKEENVNPIFHSEIYSTKEAERGSSKKELIDSSSAAIILQSYIDSKHVI